MKKYSSLLVLVTSLLAGSAHGMEAPRSTRVSESTGFSNSAMSMDEAMRHITTGTLSTEKPLSTSATTVGSNSHESDNENIPYTNKYEQPQGAEKYNYDLAIVVYRSPEEQFGINTGSTFTPHTQNIDSAKSSSKQSARNNLRHMIDLNESDSDKEAHSSDHSAKRGKSPRLAIDNREGSEQLTHPRFADYTQLNHGQRKTPKSTIQHLQRAMNCFAEAIMDVPPYLQGPKQQTRTQFIQRGLSNLVKATAPMGRVLKTAGKITLKAACVGAFGYFVGSTLGYF